ncbi:MAG: hypothetical protein OMM_04490 [Candidatus Magnetoglobus multicellularis str. Araruama]|uniref:Fibronectin type-III domain-containing protein n=1 Tax=Candidatus Magnetoglobus multicellularis str. Araruama TaxID=890399 RepID=A0A1V1P119_9BACT|nr:MAG: hypothetical protein OMM_04490 [Candidatus Magnetoglobus multicellularis str. Araruama]
MDTAFAGSEFSHEATFTVGEMNDPPIISSIEKQQTIIDYPISIPFQLTDSGGGQIRISVSSSLTSLVMPENIRFTGTNITSDGSNYTIHTTASMPEDITMVIQPVSGQSGDAMLTITVDDSEMFVQESLNLSVLPLFTEDKDIDLPGISKGSVTFGDYDNDGDLDIFITGSSDSDRIAKVYRNTGSTYSKDTAIYLPGVYVSTGAFGDYDQDGDLDILYSGFCCFAKLYRNTNGSFFEDTYFDEFRAGSVAFGDYDNDGDLDIIVSGYTTNTVTKVYQNTGGNFSEDTSINLPGVSSSAIKFGDYDNDADLDILVTGSGIAKVYRNTWGTFSEDTNINLPGISSSSADFGDYDNDGDLDIIISGESDEGRITKIYRNLGGNFSELTATNLTGVDNSSIAFGDYDNDGDLDVLITGNSDIGRIAKVYRNTGVSFIEDTDISFPGVDNSSAAFGDYDNDGDLDILIAGESDNGKIANIYRNNTIISNTLPSSPSQLSSIVTGEKVQLSWSAGSDGQTVSQGLNYNLRIGSSSGACDILSPMSLSLTSGYRQIPSKGQFQNLTTTIFINKVGTYYWSVQAIDTAFAGSSFSEEYSFTIIDTGPTPGNNGLITSSSLNPSASESHFSWSVASDSLSLTNALEYRIYTSNVSYGDHVIAWESFASAQSNWFNHTNTFLITNQDPFKASYFLQLLFVMNLAIKRFMNNYIWRSIMRYPI